MKFVIIGGDAAGMSAASRVKRKNPDIEITVLEQTHDVSYSACGMPYNIADPERDMEKLVVRKADIVLVAMGVKPCSEMAKDAGLDLGISDSISVNRQLKTSDENIYSAGDCADAYHIVNEKKCWIPLALRANRAGWAVADNICGIETRLKGVAGTSVFKVFSLEVARTGLNLQEAQESGFDAVENYVKTRSKAHGQPGSTPIHINMVADKKTGRLLGTQMVGKEGVAHRINSIAVALYNKMGVEDFAGTDLAYAPPFSPVWDPLLTAANQLVKKI